MKKSFLCLSACSLVCACSVTFPVKGTTDKGEIFTGEAVASLSEGVFNITSNNGISCNGTYDQLSTEPTIKVYVKCSDGRHGMVLAKRDDSLQNGVGTGKMNDGTKFTFAFGNKI